MPFTLGLRAAALLGILLALAACGDAGTQSAQTPTSSASAGTESVLNRGNGAEPESLDPALANTSWENVIIGDLMMGLYTEDARGAPIYGAAVNATTSPDGRTWTFTLRDHQWSDGQPVTAEDFVYAWRRTLDPKTGSKYGSILYPFKNARAIAEGKMPATALGVRATDEKTLVLELDHPAPYMAELLTHNITYPVPRHVLEAKGNAWTAPGTYVSNGPYVLTERIPNDHITTEKNPRFYDAENVSIARVVYHPSEDGATALRRFRAGELDTQEPFPADQIDWLRMNMPEALQLVPTLALDYISVNMTRQPFQDAKVREALDLALDRDVIANSIYRIGEQPAYNIVPLGIANYPGGAAQDFKDLPYADRVARAQALMRQAGYGPGKPLRTTYSISTLPDQRRAAAAIQAMWRAVYVEVAIVPSESIINYTKLREGDFDIGAGAWAADFNDASNFLMILTGGNPQNYSRYRNARFDALFAKSEDEPDGKKRGEMLREAERIALADHAMITRNFRSTRVIVQPYVKGWIANARDINRTRWLSLEER